MRAPRTGHSIVDVNLRDRVRNSRYVFDSLVATTVLILGLVATVEITSDVAAQYSRESDWLNIVLIVLMTVPLVLRRIYPRSVFGVIFASWVIDRWLDYPDNFASFGVAIAFYTIGAQLNRRDSARVGGVAAVAAVTWTTVGAITLESVEALAIAAIAISTATPLLLGREMHERRRAVAELEQKAIRAEEDRSESARRAVADERTRIARELHDVVAHQMTVMTLQAEGARRIADTSDERLVEALDTIRAEGHSALSEMRRMVGLLRNGEDEELEVAPLPSLDDVDSLVSQVNGAGVPVTLEVSGEIRPVSDVTGLSAYRIIQESLTNVARHGGPGVSATVHVDYRPELLDIVVTDDGRGVLNTHDGDVGHGLVGMRERVSVLGGQLHTGPHPGGGFQVHAEIPLKTP